MQTRNTIQRQIVLQAVNQIHNHPTADAIYAVIAAQHPTISKATVYRNLNQLAAQGEILRVPVPTGADHFDFNIKPHYHVRCTKCGGVLMYLCRLSPISSTAWRIPPAWSCIGMKFCLRVFAALAGKTKRAVRTV